MILPFQHIYSVPLPLKSARYIVIYQLIQLIPGLDEVIRDIQGGEVVAAREPVQRVDLVVRHPQLLQRARHIF